MFDRIKAFNFVYEREVYPNDGSIETTIKVTWLYRSLTWAWSRQIRKSECLYHSGDGCLRFHWDMCTCKRIPKRWPKEPVDA